MADTTLSFLAANCYAGQKRTGKNKQFTFLNGDEVWKGPYSQSKMDMIMMRSNIMKQWKTPLIVHPLRTEGEWIIFPNVAKDYPIEKYNLNKESFSNYEYWVIERNVVDKMNFVVEKNKWLYDIPDIIEACVHMWILEIGDTGFFNILVDTKKKSVYVIDYEECAGSVREGEYFYFSKDPAKKFNWSKNVSKYYGEIADRLKRLYDISPKYSDKISRAIKLLHYHGNVVIEDTSDIKEVTEQMEGVQVSRNGRMEWHGMFGGTITFSGYKMDVIKSGLQKYIRRAMSDKATYCAFEMFRLREVGGTAVVTNLYNRIRIIAAEDIGVGDFSVAIAVIDMVNSENRDPKIVLSMVKMLSTVMKTRLGSHLYNTYRKPEARSYAESIGIAIDEGYSEADEQFISQHDNDTIFKDIVNDDLKACAIIFYKKLLDRDYNVVTWWGYFEHYANVDNVKLKMRNAYHDGTKWRKSSKPISILFDVLDKFVDNGAMNTIKHAYFSMPDVKPTEKKPNPRNENRCIVSMAIAAALFDVPYQKIGIIPDNNVDSLMNGNYTLTIDDYVIDKHTAEGSRQGKSRQDFVNEGAIVYPENMKFHIDKLYDVYMNCKDL